MTDHIAVAFVSFKGIHDPKDNIECIAYNRHDVYLVKSRVVPVLGYGIHVLPLRSRANSCAGLHVLEEVIGATEAQLFKAHVKRPETAPALRS